MLLRTCTVEVTVAVEVEPIAPGSTWWEGWFNIGQFSMFIVEFREWLSALVDLHCYSRLCFLPEET